MLPRARRVHTQSDYQRIFDTGRQYRGPNLLLFVASAEGISRIGIVVGKHFSAKAVHRNRLKRQLRAIAANHLGQLKPNHLVVLNGSRCRHEADYQTLAAEVDQLFIKARLL